MSASRSTEEGARGRAGGFSLLEVLIAVALLGLILGIALQSMSESVTFTGEAAGADDMRTRSSMALHRVGMHVRSTQRNKLRTRDGSTKHFAAFFLHKGWNNTAKDIDWSSEEYVYRRASSSCPSTCPVQRDPNVMGWNGSAWVSDKRAALELVINRGDLGDLNEAGDTHLEICRDLWLDSGGDLQGFMVEPSIEDAFDISNDMLYLTVIMNRRVGTKAGGVAAIASVTAQRVFYIQPER